MKKVLLIIFILKPVFSFGQVLKDSSNKLPTEFTINVDVAALKNQRVNSYVDSINCYRGGELPRFLLDKCFELTNRDFWPGLHKPISVRWLILKKIDDKKTLERILKRKDERLKQKCGYVIPKEYPSLDIPMINISFYELMKKRYKEL